MPRISGWIGPLTNQKMGWDVSRKHGMHGTPTYHSWNGMIQRCLNPRNTRWNSYGGSGVTVCDRWLKFENFFTDMGTRPKGKTIDRYPDPFGNYEPGNCRWASPKQQQNNMRSHNFITFQGKTLILSEWSKELGIGITTIGTRLKRGWPVERALGKSTTDTRSAKNTSGFPGVYRSGNNWSAQLRINGERTHLGNRKTAREAYQLRLEAAKTFNIRLQEGDSFL